MQFYLLLTVVTLTIGGLAALVWRQTRSIAVLLGIAFLYYWSLHGGWFVIHDLRGGDSGMHYHYLFERMFPVHLDGDYLCALAYLGLFVITVELVVLWYLQAPPLPKPLPASRLIRISHPKLLTVCGLSGAASYQLMHESLAFAASQDLSVYLVTRGATDYDVISWFTLHATLNRLALFPAAIGLAVLVSGSNGRMVVGRGGAGTLFAYIVLLATMFAFCLILGNKNELFIALVTGVLFYWCNDLRPRKALVVVLGVVALAAVALVDYVRGAALADLHELLSADSVLGALAGISSSNEAFAGHMSMYGCLHYEVPLTYGSSVVSLIAAVVPHRFWPDRPPDIYVHYAESLQTVAGQGYSIHHAAGWYLNFGLAGVMLGGAILGWIWSQLFLAARRIQHYRAPTLRLFFSFAALSLSAYLPTLIRAGPEVYKGMIIDAFLVPFTALWLSGKRTAARPAYTPTGTVLRVTSHPFVSRKAGVS